LKGTIGSKHGRLAIHGNPGAQGSDMREAVRQHAANDPRRMLRGVTSVSEAISDMMKGMLHIG
jgi:hypothetical protein